jgi:hypothetical protein
VNGINLEQFIYERGYHLEHLFLRAYDQSLQPINELAKTSGYNLGKVMRVLNMIGFKGKIILGDNGCF